MPGLFGGGGDQMSGAPTNIPITAKAPPWAANMHNVMTPASAPGQRSMLASNMAAGGFGTSAQDLAWLNSFYKPAPSAYFTGSAPKPKAKVTPKVAPKVAPVGPTAAPAPKRPSSLGHNAR